MADALADVVGQVGQPMISTRCGRANVRMVTVLTGGCPACGDLYALTLDAAIWKHRRYLKDDRGLLIRRVCPGSGQAPSAPR